MREAAAYVRARKGPALVHAHVIRPYSHSLSDDEKLYKTPAEREAEARRDPIRRFAEFLQRNELATAADLAAITAEIDREIDEAAQIGAAAREAAEETPPPTTSSRPTSIRRRRRSRRPRSPKAQPDTMVTAINRTLKDEMARNPRIVVFGEDVADASRKEALAVVPGKGGVFKVTHGLQRQFGDDRVFNAPIAEASIIGRGVGMATRGLKPVVEIQFFDYIWPAMMQLRNEMAMMRYRSANHWSCPMVIRVPDRRLSARRRAVSQPVGREHLRALPGHPHRVSRRTRSTRRDCCARRSAATIRCCSSSTSTSTARPTTRASIPATTS